MSNITENIKYLKSRLPSSVRLVAVSKTKTRDEILEAYHAGHTIFGENKVQELLPKYEQLPKDIEWHYIGHLQTNKVKYIAPFVNFIHSVDSLKLLAEINKEANKNNRIIPCLFEIHIAQEETKYGLDIEELKTILCSEEIKQLQNISICGLMGMATFTDDMEHVRKEFRFLAAGFKEIKETFFKTNSGFKEISMGMSGDYKIAVEEGSTMVRVGSSIFGDRIYS
ncbi:MAG: YggS family pyridoxal phosphate-dependent enzyme [Bacteroidia bacterium]|nr:YggS family pyridoxal phosphate-dependent enzyme [Bacteroidia bacterium]